MYNTSTLHMGLAGAPERTTQERSISELWERRTYWATWALVSMTPRGSMMTPLPDMGRSASLPDMHKMLTRAARARSLMVWNGRGGNGEGAAIRATTATSWLSGPGGA